MVATPRDMTPYVESEALKKKLSGITVHASNYTEGRPVPVGFVDPDFELVKAAYPGIYLSYAGMSKASDREHRGPTRLEYAPAGFATDVQVPLDMENKTSDLTESWETTLDRRRSPYHLGETPIPYNLDFNITALSRNYQQMFEVVTQLDSLYYLPARFGWLDVPQDGTVRTLDLLGGPNMSTIQDEDGKRLLQSVYSVRVTAELSLFDVTEINRATTVTPNLTTISTSYL